MGATKPTKKPGSGLGEFQSSPTWSGGCNANHAMIVDDALNCFNPHPPGRVGATRRIVLPGTVQSGFQSSPTWSGGCNTPTRAGHHPQVPGFNPHPPGRVGATSGITSPTSPGRSFQSSPTWSGGCNRVGRSVFGSYLLFSDTNLCWGWCGCRFLLVVVFVGQVFWACFCVNRPVNSDCWWFAFGWVRGLGGL